jgi:hypothetical protein
VSSRIEISNLGILGNAFFFLFTPLKLFFDVYIIVSRLNAIHSSNLLNPPILLVSSRVLYFVNPYTACHRLPIYMELEQALWMVVKFEGLELHGYAQRYMACKLLQSLFSILSHDIMNTAGFCKANI